MNMSSLERLFKHVKNRANVTWLLGGMGAVLLTLFVMRADRNPRYQPMSQIPQITPDEPKRSDGDTPLDTIKALQAYAKAAVDRAETLHAANAEHAEQVLVNAQAIERLQSELNTRWSHDERLQETIEGSRKAALDRMAERLRTLEKQLNSVNTTAEFPIRPGSLNGSESHNDELDALLQFPNRATQTGRWFASLEHEHKAEEGSAFHFVQGESQSGWHSNELDDWNTSSLEENDRNTKEQETTSSPVYTLPKDTILSDALALTALIGRIPVAGTTPDPYPVKIFIGRENLMANGHDLPDIDGMIFSGLGFGDWNLQCVNARLYSATYIFEDGRVVNHSSNGTPLAYLSDPHGVPCIAGELKTNAPAFVAQSMSLAGLSAAGSIYAQAQQGMSTGNTDVLVSITESMGRAGVGRAVDSATQDVSRWLLERQQQSFDAVVVPPGAQVAVHLEKSLPIDYSPNLRRVRYENVQSHFRTLD